MRTPNSIRRREWSEGPPTPTHIKNAGPHGRARRDPGQTAVRPPPNDRDDPVHRAAAVFTQDPATVLRAFGCAHAYDGLQPERPGDEVLKIRSKLDGVLLDSSVEARIVVNRAACEAWASGCKATI